MRKIQSSGLPLSIPLPLPWLFLCSVAVYLSGPEV